MRKSGCILFACVVGWSVGAHAHACDPCALYSASRLQGHDAGTLTLSLSQQYTNFERSAEENESSVRDGELVEGFSTSNLSLNYDLTDSVGVQASLPLVARRFDRVERYRVDSDSEFGIGDVALSGTYSPLHYSNGDWTVLGGITGGLKFSTGETGVLGDIAEEEPNVATKHHQLSPAGGRALTFGSGSFDGILGAHLLARYQRFVSLSSVQYTVRTEGSFDYEFADDFIWSGSAGYYFFLEHEFTLAALIALSGELKGSDHLNGVLVPASSVSNTFVGPLFLMTFAERMSAELGFDVRSNDEDESSSIVPETRVRAAISCRF